MDNRLSKGMTRGEVVALPSDSAREDTSGLSGGVGLRGSCEFLDLSFPHDGRLEDWHRVQP